MRTSDIPPERAGADVPSSPIEIARGIFDRTWYPGSGAPGTDPFEEFLERGARPGGDPHPLFSVDHYLRAAPELEAGGESPLIHYARDGWRRGLGPHPLIDTAFYARRYGRDVDAAEDPLTHYLREGAERGFRPHAWFDTEFYKRNNPDVTAAGVNPLVHFVTFGAAEGRAPNAEFPMRLHMRRRDLPSEVNALGDFLGRLARARSAPPPPESPEYSIVILNYNKPFLTVQSAVEVLEDPALVGRAEIIVVDNGSETQNYEILRSELPPAVRVLRLEANRFFGEGNNLGAEIARGRYVVFLNNDAFVDPGAIDALRDAFIRHPDCGAAGPRFLYPDGRVQEAGAMMSACGIALQRGKFLSPSFPLYERTEPVDYVSAACVMLPRALFDEIGGFDLIWDPAYYEDADLGLKVRLLGKRVYYCPDATVVHIENVTSGDEGLPLRMNGIVEVNREKFIARWSQWIAGGGHAARPPVRLPSRVQRPRARATALLFTPYPLYAGGGERYLLTFAESIAERYDVVLATPERYSRVRIRTIARDLGLDLSHVEPIARRDVDRYAGCELFVAMGNEMYPPVPAYGRVSIFHCQFPFAMSAEHVSHYTRHLAGYDAVIVNSEFTAAHYRADAERYGEIAPEVFVVAPPVPQVAPGDVERVPSRILNVGRFAPKGHSKRQDVLIAALERLLDAHPDAELHLAGTVPADGEAREYALALRRAARDLPVTFHLNVSGDALADLYRSSSVYWHATGFGRPPDVMPEFQEHFGIAIVEAMSAGAYPIVFRGGGPPGYLVEGITGDLWTTTDELVERTHEFLVADEAERSVRRTAARIAARRFDVPVFAAAVNDIVERLSAGAARDGRAAVAR